MRVSTTLMQFRATNAIVDREAALSKTQLQLATGRKILTPSDDPVGTTQVYPLNEVIERNKQYLKNSDSAESRLSLEEKTLSSVTNLLQRVNELAVQGNNGSNSAEDRSAIAQELRQHLKTLLGFANTKDANGEYIFSGHEVTTQPFTEAPAGTFNYQGDTGQRSVQIGESRLVEVGDPGSDVFMNVPYSGGGNQSVFETIDKLATDFENNSFSANSITDVQAAMDNVVNTRAKIGARLNALDTQKNINEELTLQSQKTLSGIQDLDYAEAVSRLNLQMVGLQASQQAFTRIQNLSLFNYL
jgi:flagellar hook-associated protein 3 FlgL